MIVNTASKCGFTPQYQGLQKLYDNFADRGLEVLGFPCNQFGHQEPGGAGEIGAFCEKNYGVGFPMFDKIDVNGDDAHPCSAFSRRRPRRARHRGDQMELHQIPGGPGWPVVRRYAPKDKPEKIADDIEALL